jgi:hypothetical protein
MLRNESLRWAQVLSALKACSGERVRIRDGSDYAPAGEIATRPTAKGSAFGLVEAGAATTRVSLIERLEALSKNSATRFRASASARAEGAHLPIEAVRDETDDDGTVWATIETRRPKLAYNASQSTVRFPGGRSKQVKR